MQLAARNALALLFWAAALVNPASAACGDGVFEEPLEECDDHNTADGDGCSADCALECQEVGAAATEHTCLHAMFGPYDAVATQAYPPGFINSAIEAPHTHYTLSLAGAQSGGLSATTYWPIQSGTFAFYTTTQPPLAVYTEALEAVPLRLEHAISACQDPGALTWVRVYDLTSESPYYVVFGPSSETEAVVVVERLNGFKAPRYRDADGDGWGNEERALYSWCEVPGHASEGADCDDSTATTYSGAPELCNAVDDDCDPLTIEVCAEDAGTAVDAGLTDAGEQSDAGDAGASEDAGFTLDAGTAHDASAEVDSSSDASVEPPPRARDAALAEPDGDDEPRPGEGPVDGPAKGRDDSGCQAASGTSAGGGWSLLAALALVARGRARRRVPTASAVKAST